MRRALGAIEPFKDLLDHREAWQRFEQGRLGQALGSDRPAPPWPAGLDPPQDQDRLNRHVYEVTPDRPLAETPRASRRTWDRLEEGPAALPEAALIDPGIFSGWRGGNGTGDDPERDCPFPPGPRGGRPNVAGRATRNRAGRTAIRARRRGEPVAGSPGLRDLPTYHPLASGSSSSSTQEAPLRRYPAYPARKASSPNRSRKTAPGFSPKRTPGARSRATSSRCWSPLTRRTIRSAEVEVAPTTTNPAPLPARFPSPRMPLRIGPCRGVSAPPARRPSRPSSPSRSSGRRGGRQRGPRSSAPARTGSRP